MTAAILSPGIALLSGFLDFYRGGMPERLRIVITLGVLSLLAFPFGQWLFGKPIR